MKFYWITLLLYTVVVLSSVLFPEIALLNAFVGGLISRYTDLIVCRKKNTKKYEKLYEI